LAQPIIKENTRVLRPFEYAQLRQGAGSISNQTRLDSLLLSGVRYVEAVRLQRHPKWLDHQFIRLPEFASRKKLRTQKERWVRLSTRGVATLPHFFESRRLPDWGTWRGDLVRWAQRSGLDPEGLGPKSLRKTWESWLLFCYPQKTMQICQSQGHTELTSLKYYANLPFTETDQQAMQEWTSGW